MINTITFRPITGHDEPFLRKLYASTRTEELMQTGWSDSQKLTFLDQQFTAQSIYYSDQFRKAEFLIVLKKSNPIGRLYIDRRADEIRIIDIALLPEYRQKGIGSYLLKNVLSEAQQAGKPVRIHVERFNPALHLYHRLGFKNIGDTGVYYLMEWSAPGVESGEPPLS